MVFVNLAFVVLNSMILSWALSEGKDYLAFINVLAVVFNLVPIIGRLLEV